MLKKELSDFEQYRKRFGSMLLKKGFGASYVEDAIQETFFTFRDICIKDRFSEFEGENNLFKYLATTCVHKHFRLCYRGSNIAKSKTLKESYLDEIRVEREEESAYESSPFDKYYNVEIFPDIVADDLLEIINKIPGRDIEAILLAIKGLDNETIAREMGLTKRSVEVNKGRARKKLNKLFS